VVDVKSAIGRFGLIPASPPPNPPDEVECVAWFRFPVTWAYLSDPPPEVERVLPIRPVSQPLPTAMTLVSVPAPPVQAPVVIDTSSSGADSRPASSGAQWEMVIPKMARPAAKRIADRTPVAPAALAAPAAPTAPAPMFSIPANIIKEYLPSGFTAPSLLLFTADDKFLARFWRQIVLALVAIVAVVFLLSGHSGAGASSAGRRAAEVSSIGGWSRNSILPPGRMMSVYDPSRDESDYRIEFAWVPDAKGVGWVFRTRDAGDYYATRLTLVQPGASLVLAAEHFSVLGGVESAHSRKVIPLANNSGLVRVRMDAIGPAFTLSLQDSPVDYWTDARLDSGALGFYDERGLRPEVQMLRFTFIKKGTNRMAEASLP
jgi:hypothetical protein